MRLVALCIATFFAAERSYAACTPATEYGCLPVTLFGSDGHDARLRYAPEFAPRAAGAWTAGLDIHGTLDSLRASPNSPSTPDSSEALVRERLEATLRASVAVAQSWTLHMAAPMVVAQSGLVGARSGPSSAIAPQAIGDLRLGAAFRASVAPGFSFASRLAVALPTASENAFAGGRSATVLPDVSLQAITGMLTAYVGARARFELASRAPYDAPTSWLGAAAGVQLQPWGPKVALHTEFLGYAATSALSPYAQDRSGRPRTDLPGQTLAPAMVSVGVSGKGVLCSSCAMHASFAGMPDTVLAPALSAIVRLEYFLRPKEVVSQ